MPATTSNRWSCPECHRVFGAVGRSHMCAPGLTLDEFVERESAATGAIVRRVVAHLESVDDGALIVDPVDAAVLCKNGGTFASIRVMKKWTAVGFSVRRRIDSARFSRKVQEYQGKFFHVVNVVDADDIDEEFCEWLTEAFSGERPNVDDSWSPDGGANGDPMVPDDVDVFIEPPR